MIPLAEEQLRFLDNIQRLMTEGSFVSTYKFALLSSLLDLSIEKDIPPDGSLTISIDEIAGKFISYYWPQVRPYTPSNNKLPDILLQNGGKQAAIINIINEAQNSISTKLKRVRSNQSEWSNIQRQVSRLIVNMPLWRLQTVGDTVFDFLYPNTGGVTDSITLKAGAAFNFRKFHGLISNQIQSAWVLQLHRISQNQPLLGTASDLKEFLFGSERSNLDVYRPILRELQSDRCHYCSKPINDAGEVDHFIPWVRYPVDLGHNFVLAHKTCNNAKRDYLGEKRHLENWVERNTVYADALISAFDDECIEYNLNSSIHVAKWAYEQVDNTGSLVWSEGKVLHQLESDWRSVI